IAAVGLACAIVCPIAADDSARMMGLALIFIASLVAVLALLLLVIARLGWERLAAYHAVFLAWWLAIAWRYGEPGNSTELLGAFACIVSGVFCIGIAWVLSQRPSRHRRGSDS